jgi:hypothetical protein
MADVKNNHRKDRLSAALRENLKRRKQQLRGRAGQPGGSRDGDAEAARDETAEDPAGRAGRDDRE